MVSKQKVIAQKKILLKNNMLNFKKNPTTATITVSEIPSLPLEAQSSLIMESDGGRNLGKN